MNRPLRRTTHVRDLTTPATGRTFRAGEPAIAAADPADRRGGPAPVEARPNDAPARPNHIPVYSNEAPARSGHVSAGLSDAPAGSGHALVGSSDARGGLGDVPAGLSEVSVGSSDAPARSGSAPIGSGDVPAARNYASPKADGDAGMATATDRRLLLVWCRDWPAVAASAVAGLSPEVPTAVVAANRVVACSATARLEGIRRGTRRRDAQARCPSLAVFELDPDRDTRLFEPVAAAVESLAPGVEVIRPGLIAVPARGPVGYFGGPHRAAERLVDQVSAETGAECQVGVADGLFAALLAAHRGVAVPIGGAADFLAPLSISELDQPADRSDAVDRAGRLDRSDRAELIDLLRRLGIRTLGAFAAIPEHDVATRFGATAVIAHRLAAGRGDRPLARRRPPPELTVTTVLDPPADRVDAAAFAAKSAADTLYTHLSDRGLACTRLAIHIQTTAGEQRERVWRCAEPLTHAGIADRVRWQLDAWLRSTDGTGRPTAGVSQLRLIPLEIADGRTLQFGLWSGASDPSDETERAGRALVRVQGLLGPEGVVTAVLGGGRGPGDQVRLVPWGDERIAKNSSEPPWPGRLPAPSPAIVPRQPLPATVADESGAEVGVTGRHLLTAPPITVTVPGIPARYVRGWAGPWPVVERWWDAVETRRAARLQVVLTENPPDGNAPDTTAAGTAGDTAMLLLREDGRWLVEGIYD